MLNKQGPGGPEIPAFKTLSDINPETGLSSDYLNEVAYFRIRLGSDTNYAQQVEIITSYLATYPIPTYTEKYEASNYVNVFNDSNVESVKAVDALASELNQPEFKEVESFPIERFIEIYNQIYSLASNNPRHEMVLDDGRIVFIEK